MPEPRPLSLKALLGRLESDFLPLARDKGLTLGCETCEAWVHSDPALLERVLRNLLDNAVKYTEQGRIDLLAAEGEREVRVSVRDTGIGIAAADLGRIFEEYYQVRNPARDRSQGIGLGLAIVNRMCDLLDHKVEVDSMRGQGSVFSIALPRCAPASSHAAGARPPAAASREALDTLRGAVVVVIEDDAEVSEAMRRLLLQWACRPVIAAGSGAAIAQLEAEGLDPDAILADWRLAESENGLQAIERINIRYGMRPAAIVTGEIDPAELTVPEHMTVSVLQKPVRAREISDWLLRHRAMD